MKPKISRTEGGSGGKRGHSGMSHYEYTEIIKAKQDRVRRRVDKAVVDEQLDPDLLSISACPICGESPHDPEAHEIEVIAFFAGRDPLELLAELLDTGPVRGQT